MSEKNTVADFGLDPKMYDNSRRAKDYRRYDQVRVINLSNYKQGRETPFWAYVKKVQEPCVIVGCMDSNEEYELYDYQLAYRKYGQS